MGKAGRGPGAGGVPVCMMQSGCHVFRCGQCAHQLVFVVVFGLHAFPYR